MKLTQISPFICCKEILVLDNVSNIKCFILLDIVRKESTSAEIRPSFKGSYDLKFRNVCNKCYTNIHIFVIMPRAISPLNSKSSFHFSKANILPEKMNKIEMLI